MIPWKNCDVCPPDPPLNPEGVPKVSFWRVRQSPDEEESLFLLRKKIPHPGPSYNRSVDRDSEWQPWYFWDRPGKGWVNIKDSRLHAIKRVIRCAGMTVPRLKGQRQKEKGKEVKWKYLSPHCSLTFNLWPLTFSIISSTPISSLTQNHPP